MAAIKKKNFHKQISDPAFSDVKTVQVDNVALGASEQHVKEFFQYCGVVEHIEMQSDTEETQIAYVTFNDTQGAKIAIQESGKRIIDREVTITLKLGYELPLAALPTDETGLGHEDVGGETGDTISRILAVVQSLSGTITSLIATFTETQTEISGIMKELQEISEKAKERMGEAAQVSSVEKAVAEVGTEEKVVEKEPSEPVASTPAKAKKLKRPTAW